MNSPFRVSSAMSSRNGKVRSPPTRPRSGICSTSIHFGGYPSPAIRTRPAHRRHRWVTAWSGPEAHATPLVPPVGMCPRDIGGVDHQLFPRCAALTDKLEGRHGGSMGLVMTELQVSIGLDRSDRRAGESMVSPCRSSIPGRPTGHRRDGRGLARRARVERGRPGFRRAVTILDEEGAQMVTVEWPAPTDGRPICPPNRHGWHRVG